MTPHQSQTTSHAPHSLGRVALITGASRGIGRAIALDLARHGYDIVPTARSLHESVVPWDGTLDETAECARSMGRRALPVKMDLRNQTEIQDGVAAALEEFGRVDVLVTSATHIDFSPGGTYLNQFVDTRWEAIQEHFEITALSTLRLMHLLLPVMLAQGSGIVMNITQNASWLKLRDLPLPGRGMCGMAIPVIRGVTDRIAPALAREVAGQGVSVLTLDPGMTLSNAPERFEDTRRAGFVPEQTHSIAVPARAAAYIATCDDPSAFNGQFVIAQDLVRSLGLLSEEQIFPDWNQGVQDVGTLPPLPGFS